MREERFGDRARLGLAADTAREAHLGHWRCTPPIASTGRAGARSSAAGSGATQTHHGGRRAHDRADALFLASLPAFPPPGRGHTRCGLRAPASRRLATVQAAQDAWPSLWARGSRPGPASPTRWATDSALVPPPTHTRIISAARCGRRGATKRSRASDAATTEHNLTSSPQANPILVTGGGTSIGAGCAFYRAAPATIGGWRGTGCAR